MGLKGTWQRRGEPAVLLGRGTGNTEGRAQASTVSSEDGGAPLLRKSVLFLQEKIEVAARHKCGCKGGWPVSQRTG